MTGPATAVGATGLRRPTPPEWSEDLLALVGGSRRTGPGGHRWVPPGEPVTGTPRPAPVDLAGWQVVREDAAEVVPTTWLAGLARVRLDMSARLFGDALTYLSGRRAGGDPLLHQQLMKGAVADVEAEHELLRATLTGLDVQSQPPTPAAVGMLHLGITAVDALVLQTAGAAGYLRRGPAGAAYVSELLADTYLGLIGVGAQ